MKVTAFLFVCSILLLMAGHTLKLQMLAVEEKAIFTVYIELAKTCSDIKRVGNSVLGKDFTSYGVEIWIFASLPQHGVFNRQLDADYRFQGVLSI